MYISTSTLLTALLAVTAAEAIKIDPKVLNNAAVENSTAGVSAGVNVGAGAAANGQQASSSAREGVVAGISESGNAKAGAAVQAKTGAAQVAGGGVNTLAALPGSAVADTSLKALPGLATGAAAAAPASLQPLPAVGGGAVAVSVRYQALHEIFFFFFFFFLANRILISC